MNQALVDQIVDAVLYEGYILYPYRPSIKNRQRWTFGGLYPRAYCEAQQPATPGPCRRSAWCADGLIRLFRSTCASFISRRGWWGNSTARIAELAESDEPVFHVVEKLESR